MSSEDSKNEKEAPSHLFSLEAGARSYQIMIGRLKGGARSGISNLFGSAEDLFSEAVDVPEIPRLVLSSVDLSDKDERQWRAIYLAMLLRADSMEMLKAQLRSSRAGDFGAEIARLAKPPVPGKTFHAAAKELCCVAAYLLALEQGIMEPEAESWFRDFIEICLSVLDGLLSEPPVVELMPIYETLEANKACQKVASHLGQRLGFGEVGDAAWSELRRLVLCSGQARYQLLIRAVQMPITEVHSNIAVLQQAVNG